MLNIFSRTGAFALLIPSLIALLLSGCAGGDRNDEEQISAVQVGQVIEQAADLSEMKKGDMRKLQKLYHIREDQVENFVLYTAPTNVKAEEVAVIQVKDANDIKSIMTSIKQRIEEQGSSFKDYLPEQYYYIENYILKSKGRLILFVISADAEKIEQAFDKTIE